MKLYARWQVLFFSLLSAAGAIVLTVLLFVYGSSIDRDEILPGLVNEPRAMEIQYTQELSSSELVEPTKDEYNNIRIYEALNEAVVNITSISLKYNWFLDPIPQEGTGSGSIIDESGLVLTNYHVVRNAEDLVITLADGSEHEGTWVGYDQENDLAVIRFKPPQDVSLVFVPFGTSSNLKIGQKVLAIGNPFALDRTLTTGVVSGLGRAVRIDTGLIINNMIQTDASINPGNSGGPLLNSKGEMIGINTVIKSSSGESIGIGFAVSVDTARRVVQEIIKYGKVLRGWIDIEYAVQLFPALARLNKTSVTKGLLVSEVNPGSNAYIAGIRGGNANRFVRYKMRYIYLEGDIIIELDGSSVTTLADLYSALEDNKPGETVPVVVVRGRQKKTFFVELSERPSSFPWY